MHKADMHIGRHGTFCNVSTGKESSSNLHTMRSTKFATEEIYSCQHSVGYLCLNHDFRDWTISRRGCLIIVFHDLQGGKRVVGLPAWLSSSFSDNFCDRGDEQAKQTPGRHKIVLIVSS